MSNAPAIQVEHVIKSFGSRMALNDVTLSVSTGQIVALLGPNGGGKTTLFRILCSLLKPDAGWVAICGADPRQSPNAVRRHIGVVFQSPSLDKKLTCKENLKHHGHLYGLWGLSLRRRIRELLEAFGLLDRANDRVETLSGGLARRVEIAKSMLPGPRVLLLDEPGSGLDPAARRELWRQLDRLRSTDGVTVLMTTHQVDESQQCDRVAILDAGRLVAEGAPEELVRRVRGDVITIHADDPDELAQRIQSEYSLPAVVVNGAIHLETTHGAEQVPRLARALGDRIRSLTLGRPTLEDVFIHVTGKALD